MVVEDAEVAVLVPVCVDRDVVDVTVDDDDKDWFFL